MSIPTEDVLVKGFDPQVTRRLMVFVRPHWRPLLFSLFLMLTGNLVTVLGPYLIKIAIDSGMRAGSLATLRQSVGLYFVLIIVQWAVIYLRVNIMARVGTSIIYELRRSLFEHLQKLSLSFYSRFSVGRIIVRVINDVGVLREFITWAVLAIARDLFAAGRHPHRYAGSQYSSLASGLCRSSSHGIRHMAVSPQRP